MLSQENKNNIPATTREEFEILSQKLDSLKVPKKLIKDAANAVIRYNVNLDNVTSIEITQSKTIEGEEECNFKFLRAPKTEAIPEQAIQSAAPTPLPPINTTFAQSGCPGADCSQVNIDLLTEEEEPKTQLSNKSEKAQNTKHLTSTQAFCMSK